MRERLTSSAVRMVMDAASPRERSISIGRKMRPGGREEGREEGGGRWVGGCEEEGRREGWREGKREGGGVPRKETQSVEPLTRMMYPALSIMRQAEE